MKRLKQVKKLNGWILNNKQMELLEFIFRSGYTFIGSIILIAVIFDGIEGIVRHFKKR